MKLNSETITNFADFLLDNIDRSNAAATMMEEENHEAWIVHKSQVLAYDHIYHLFEIYFLTNMELNTATITNFADFLLDSISRSNTTAIRMKEENREAWLVHKSQELAYDHIYRLFEIYFFD